MQQQIIYKHDKQSIFDLLLQHSGAISGMFEFLNENSHTNLNISEGEYIAPIVYNQDIVDFFNPEQTKRNGVISPAITTNLTATPISITINGDFYKLVNETVIDIPLKNTNGELLGHIIEGMDVVVDNVQISFYANGIFQQLVSVPVGASETININ